jgi:uncharacterized protein (DUF302 family)
MINRTSLGAVALLMLAPVALGATGASAAEPAAAPAAETVPAKGVVRIRSSKGFDATVAAIKADVAAKGIRFFTEIDQAALAGEAGLPIGRSTLVLFGNPPLGIQFLQSNRYAGLDWPVRMLVIEDESGQVWIAWSDFGWIADRYSIGDRGAQLRMASEVAASIAASANR